MDRNECEICGEELDEYPGQVICEDCIDSCSGELEDLLDAALDLKDE